MLKIHFFLLTTCVVYLSKNCQIYSKVLLSEKSLRFGFRKIGLGKNLGSRKFVPRKKVLDLVLVKILVSSFSAPEAICNISTHTHYCKSNILIIGTTSECNINIHKKPLQYLTMRNLINQM